MIALLNLAFKCLRIQQSSRPFLDWLCIILKNLTNVTDYAFR